jgi:hypothetical protein
MGSSLKTAMDYVPDRETRGGKTLSTPHFELFIGNGN